MSIAVFASPIKVLIKQGGRTKDNRLKIPKLYILVIKNEYCSNEGSRPALTKNSYWSSMALFYGPNNHAFILTIACYSNFI